MADTSGSQKSRAGAGASPDRAITASAKLEWTEYNEGTPIPGIFGTIRLFGTLELCRQLTKHRIESAGFALREQKKMEVISEELDRYSLELSEDETSQSKEEVKVPSVDIPSEKPKLSGDKHGLKVTRYMNTYRLESKRPFNEESVTAVLQEVLTRDLATAHYEPHGMTKMCVSLAGEIRNRVKQLNYDRYKLVCLVQIVEKHRQSLLSTARFLWDADRDRYAVFSMNNAHIAATACVFGIYYE